MRLLNKEHHKERNLPKNKAKWSHLPQWTILSPRIWTLCPSLGWAGASTSAHPTSWWSDSWETSCPMTGIDISGCKGDLFATAALIRPQQGDNNQSRDPALSHNTIASCWMPTQVCWHALFYFRCVSRRSFLIYLHNPCDTPINNSGLICISMAEIEDRRTHSKYSPARNKLLLVGFEGTKIFREGVECGVFLGSIPF